MHDTPEQRIKALAAELGFRPVGIADAEPFDLDLGRMLTWLDQGRQAGMGWLTPERARAACDPSTLLDGATSLIVVGAPYAPAGERLRASDGRDKHDPDARRRGVVARYARGVDYHDVMKERLTALAAFVRELGGADSRTRVFVDSSPLLERAAAVRAGLGFIGKNTNLLTREAGSFLLLGAILTTVPLEPDRPVPQDCGSCRLCLDACPTGALPEPFVLDANRCISYLTIEHRDAIPTELRAGIGSLVFGCDICQQVCPWNWGSRPPGWPEFSSAEDGGYPDPRELLSLDDAAFRERYRRTPLWRTKRRGLGRNAAVALGNVGTAADLPALAAALEDPEPLVRGHAAWAIGRIGSESGQQALRDALAVETEADVLDELSAALSKLTGLTTADPPSGQDGNRPPHLCRAHKEAAEPD
ncbi:MAG: tRNA epoxyqueuosine(34) reductase QueG [Chloroflexi bacterium]|nr:tRNA epoxyqueuosine(34) reductase QueG [Chloroflexota bacterium]